MKNILLIGQFTDISGYGHAVRSYLKTLSKIKNVHLKCLNFSFEKKETIDPLVEELSITESLRIKRGNYPDSEIKKIIEYCDQNTEVFFFLPNDWLSFGAGIDIMNYNNILNLNLICRRSKHVFPCVVWETDCVSDIWVKGYESLKNIKKLICACKWNAQVFREKLNKECIVLPYSVVKSKNYDIEYYKKLRNIKKDSFAFCNVSQWSNRKGMEELIRSFYLEFINDDVVLFLKTYTSEPMTGKKSTDFLSKKILEVKNSISHYGRKNNFKCRVVLIDQILSKDQINSIYKISDVYATCTKGEGFGLPIAEFLVNTDKPVISPDKGGHLDFIDSNNFFIESSYEPALMSMNYHYSELEMNYVQVKISSTKAKLREAFISNKEKNYSDLCHKYLSMENNIEIMKQILEI